jgi:hypothetical protein
MKRLIAAAGPAFAAAAAFAAPAGAQTEPGTEKVNQVIVYGDDPCPQSTDEEINVCVKFPESERFRIPKDIRDLPDPANRSWGARAVEMQYVGRSGIGSCSPTGPGGMVGCFNQLADQARAERRQSGEWARLVEDARRERQERIDKEAAEEEEASRPN